MVNRLAGPVLTTTLSDVILLKLAPAKPSVIVSVKLYDKFVNVTTPPIAARLVVPCSAPVPVARLAVTTVELSALRTLPNALIRITGCGANAAPAAALEPVAFE
jgi:hypothetical protein